MVSKHNFAGLTVNRSHPSFIHQHNPSRRYSSNPNQTHKIYNEHSSLTTFANLPFHSVLNSHSSSIHPTTAYDIAILGAPFDLGTTHRPGARFGPEGIRRGSKRIYPPFATSPYTNRNIFTQGLRIIDAGDADLTTLDKDHALKQLTAAHTLISSQQPHNPTASPAPRILMLGGDHTTTLSALRSTINHFGPVSLVHFDSHIDTWNPTNQLGWMPTPSAAVNHGTFGHIAFEEGLLKPDASIHVGIRGALSGVGDWQNDVRCGFETITARDLDRLGVGGVVERVKRRVGEGNVYVSVDIDVLDPAFAPGTGTPEMGGWSTRELLSVLDELRGLRVVGADVVEVLPACDGPGEITVLAAAEVACSLLGLMVETPVQGIGSGK